MERARGWIALAAVLSLASGCGGEDREATLRAASEALESAQADVERASSAVDERKAGVEAAQEQLAEARRALKDAEARLAEQRQRVDRSATDDVLFRLVQKRLLDDEKLEDVAIAASVENGSVTLSGQVPDPKLRERALEIARGVAGVTSVKSRILVPVAAPPPRGEAPAQ